MIAQLLTPGTNVLLHTSTGQLTGQVLEANELGLLITTSVLKHAGITEELRRFYPWAQIMFLQAAA
jgi:hypothetical protein